MVSDAEKIAAALVLADQIMALLTDSKSDDTWEPFLQADRLYIALLCAQRALHFPAPRDPEGQGHG